MRTGLGRALGTALAAVTLTACVSGDADDSGNQDADLPETLELKEAPALGDMVEEGTLPGLDERIPQEPLVVEPYEQLGEYGGVWQTAVNGPADGEWLNRTMGYENLVRWAPQWSGAAGDTEIVPNIAESYEVNDAGTEFTFHLRPGMKWSDGEPFTSDDIRFAYEDYVLNPDLYPAVPAHYLAGGQPATLEVHDEYSFTFTFTEPAGKFIPALATPASRSLVKPEHYLSQFHKAHNPDADALAADEGYNTWVDLWDAKQDYTTNPDVPTVYPWVITQPLGEGTSAQAERNPYYWKVDTEGRQLPYLDSIRYELFSDTEAMLAAAAQGDLDMHARHFNTDTNKPVLASSREKGRFDFFELTPSTANQMIITFNLTTANPTLRQIFTTKEFRIGLSHAIDRQQLIDAVWQRQGSPAQVAPLPTSAFYDESLAAQYTEYDVDLANRFLDDAGLTQRDAQGFRLVPDGQRVSFRVEFATDVTSFGNHADALELISDYWAEVGIEMTPDPMDRSLFMERRNGNQQDASIWGAGGGLDVLQSASNYLPISAGAGYAELWAQYYLSGGTSGEQPPASTQKQWELWDELGRTIDTERQGELMSEILDLYGEEFYHIGIVQPVAGYGIVGNDFLNVPDSMPDSFQVLTPGLTNPEQYFKTDG